MCELARLLATQEVPVEYITALEADGCTLAALEQVWLDAERERMRVCVQRRSGDVTWEAGHRAVFERVKKVPATMEMHPWRVANAVAAKCHECTG